MQRVDIWCPTVASSVRGLELLHISCRNDCNCCHLWKGKGCMNVLRVHALTFTPGDASVCSRAAESSAAMRCFKHQGRMKHGMLSTD